MAYCPRCGVQVEDRLERCPLCDTPIPESVRDHRDVPGDYPEDVIPPKPMYRPLTERQKRMFFRGLVIFFAAFPVVLTGLLDVYRNGVITWSYYVAVPVIGSFVVFWVWFRYARRTLFAITVSLVTLFLILVLLYARLDLPLGPTIPYALMTFVAVEAVVSYFVFARPRPLSGISFGIIVVTIFVMAIELVMTAGQASWSPVVASALLPPAVYTLYLGKVRRKGLNTVGFLFIDVMVMLLALDVATGGGITWSVVTSLVLAPLAAILYILHVSLFNDTDWRKALHL